MSVQRLASVNAPDDTRPAARGITARSIIIGFLATIPGVFWGVYGDVVSQTDLTSTSLMMPPVLILVFLLVINALLRKIKPAWVLSPVEIIVIYVMNTMAVILSGMGMLQFLCTTLGAVPHYQSTTPYWTQYHFLDQVPQFILPKLSSIEGFYKGDQPIPWSAWTMPILVWSGFLFTMLFCMLCINTILRKQWVERERLSYPIVQLPLEMTEERTPFFKNKIMWAGFFLACGLESLNSLAFLFPNIPTVQLRAFDLQPFFTSHPWNSIGYFPTTFYPLTIGLGFVLSTDVSFSCWFFYLLTKLESVGVSAIGWEAASGAVSAPPYLAQQSVGGFIGIGIIIVYLARNHLKEVFRHVFMGDKLDDYDEPMTYKLAVYGLIAGFAVMVAFCMAVGISPMVAAAYLGIYMVFATTIARLRAEAGPAWVMGPGWDALDTLVRPIGSSAFAQGNLVGLAYFHWFSIEMRCCPMPVQTEAMKMSQAQRTKQSMMTILLLIAIVAGIAFGFWACLKVWYMYGAGSAKVEPWRTGMGKAPFDRLTGYLINPTHPDTPGILAISFGLLFTFFLSLMRSRFFWWPFHPAGYVLANTGTMYWLWCPFLVAWFFKVIIIRYGGIKGYRTALPFFLGLVLGDYTISSLWALAGSVFGVHMYRCFPC